MESFRNRVLKIVHGIPPGVCVTYKDVAKQAGNMNASRAVGMILSLNKDTHIPCHRVVRSDGSLGGYNGLLGKKGFSGKRKILEKEGILFSKNGKVILKKTV